MVLGFGTGKIVGTLIATAALIFGGYMVMKDVLQAKKITD